MRDASRYRGDIFLRLSRVRATPCRARVRLGRSVRACRTRAELCFRRRLRGARGAAARVVRSSLSYSGILCLSMALAAVPRCGTHHDIVAIFFFAYRELERRRAGLGCAWGARSARAELEQNCAFDGAYAALEEQRPEWSAVRASIRTLATHGGRRCGVNPFASGRFLAACAGRGPIVYAWPLRGRNFTRRGAFSAIFGAFESWASGEADFTHPIDDWLSSLRSTSF